VELEEEMLAAADELRFEYAAQLRDELRELRRDLREIQSSEIEAGELQADEPGEGGPGEGDAGGATRSGARTGGMA
jgi:hypothetical protein